MWKIFSKDEKGFTGLEAAIVLVAFVVVAAVFSYVMLGAGFYTTQKSQEVVHTGVAQASSSVELSGDLIAKGDAGTPPTEIDTLTLCLQLTSGGSSVDMAKTLIVVSAPDIAPTELTLGGSADADNFAVTGKYNADTDNLLAKGEKFELTVDLDAVAAAATVPTSVGANDEFQLEIKPPQGASYTIHRQAPASISAIMTLV
ncbi:archaellin/type IV pilin N-terminal domain-containing protein [Methanosarcina sp.]|jgi:flagellin FlaB|uniref:archaellin/type IV pilin N-terminal domain-containing protein n=1 Tax=Methanosarcina sp. TaxID=2213 RepID=UPI002C9B8D51|nr:archaellin/type IV pilin N-terminal domain-containing protein [Methanosarcina sp.]HOW13260.1 flagellin [Methanosarcina sp.]